MLVCVYHIPGQKGNRIFRSIYILKAVIEGDKNNINPLVILLSPITGPIVASTWFPSPFMILPVFSSLFQSVALDQPLRFWKFCLGLCIYVSVMIGIGGVVLEAVKLHLYMVRAHRCVTIDMSPVWFQPGRIWIKMQLILPMFHHYL